MLESPHSTCFHIKHVYPILECTFELQFALDAFVKMGQGFQREVAIWNLRGKVVSDPPYSSFLFINQSCDMPLKCRDRH